MQRPPEREFYTPAERGGHGGYRNDRDFTRSGWGPSEGRQLGAGAFEPRGDEWHGGSYAGQGHYGNPGQGNQEWYGNQPSFGNQSSYGGQRTFGSQGSYGSYQRFGQERGRMGRHYGKGPRNYKRSDERIREEISDCLMAHPEIDASQIDVEVNDGEVVLRGNVEERHIKHELEDLAEGILGVRDVNNQVRVRSREEAGSENDESGQKMTGKRQHKSN
jgi:osmotically-inducible protein OsmY